uniref:Reverse transcriptase Ty1/copia-type domain-containing protein n=1 Tax=Tanacetum cinerariifolium TaxID=118510 RepID=A0A699GQB2_TANCI|nr:hypothetical protein [Tanacetum cinerariifolium]
MKGIKREFSVARTLQQNRIAEQKNRTLIEAARTMLADSILPTTFWAEAVNTACNDSLGAGYKLSRVEEKKDAEDPGNKDSEIPINDVGRKSSIKLLDDPNMPDLKDISIFEDLNEDMDVKSAFLYGKIKEEVYVCEPPGFEHPNFPNKVYKVEKVLYGLHQSPRAWKEMCTEFKKIMHKKFQTSSMGKLTFFLGLQVKQKEDGIFISQDKYMNEILNKFGFFDVKTASTPMETHKTLLNDEKGEDVDEHLYRSMIGSLMYLTSSWPDIMFADSPFDLVAYTDSDYARASLDRKSTTGEAEYVATLSCYGQVLWIQNQLLDYGYNCMQTKIHTDNKSTICIVKNPVFHSKTKHIEIRHHFIRDSNEKKLIQMIKIHTNKNVADLLTKAFDVSRFQYLIAVNPTIYTSCVEQFWTTKNAKNINEEAQIHAKVDGKKVVISEASIRRDLQFRYEEAQEALGKDIAILTKPHPTHTITQPSTSKPQKKQNPKKPKREDTEEIQPSDPIINVADEDLPEDTVPTHSNDPPLLRVHILGSGEERLKLNELIELCTKLSDRVLNLETTKTAQVKEIANIKKRVKRLERKKKLRSHGIKRLYKVRLSTRVESSADEEGLDEEDSSKQRRISDIDANQDIYLVNVDRNKDIFSVNDQDDTSMFDADKDLQGKEVVTEEINAASITTLVSVVATTLTFSMDEITLAKVLIAIKTSRPKAKRLVMQEPSQTPTPTPIVSSQQPSKVQDKERDRQEEEANNALIETWEDIQAKKRRKFLTAKRDEEKRKKPPTKAEQRSIMTTYLKNMDGWKPRALKNKSFAEIRELFDKRAGDELEQEIAKKQMLEDENESAELKRCLEIVPDDGDEDIKTKDFIDVVTDYYCCSSSWKRLSVSAASANFEESLNVTFMKSHPPTKLSPLVDDDVGGEEAIKRNTKVVNNNEEDESIEVDKIVNIKESKNHLLDQLIGNLNQRTLRSHAQNHSNFFCFISAIEHKDVKKALKDKSYIVAMQEELNQFVANDVWELVPLPISQSVIGTK